MRVKQVYECEHCNKKRLVSKSHMADHENKCWYNLKNKTCCTCKYGDILNDKRVCYHRSIKKEFENMRPQTDCLVWEQYDEFEWDGE